MEQQHMQLNGKAGAAAFVSVWTGLTLWPLTAQLHTHVSHLNLRQLISHLFLWTSESLWVTRQRGLSFKMQLVLGCKHNMFTSLPPHLYHLYPSRQVWTVLHSFIYWPFMKWWLLLITTQYNTVYNILILKSTAELDFWSDLSKLEKFQFIFELI